MLVARILVLRAVLGVLQSEVVAGAAKTVLEDGPGTRHPTDRCWRIEALLEVGHVRVAQPAGSPVSVAARPGSERIGDDPGRCAAPVGRHHGVAALCAVARSLGRR